MAAEREAPSGQMVQLVNFRLRGEEYGVDIGGVREITRVTDITRIPEAPHFVRGVTNLRGQVIPVVDLADQFGYSPQDELPASARIVMIAVDDRTVGMLVDEVPEVLKIPAEDIEPTPELIRTQETERKDYIKGVGKYEDRLIVLLDLDKLLAPSEMEKLGQAETGEKE